MIIAEYIWIGGKDELRSKQRHIIRVLAKKMDLRKLF